MDDEFKLCWKNFQDNIASGFQNLYDRGDLVDVTLACDGKLLHAHKIVLAICSPYFQEIFITNPCKHPIIILKDVTFNIMCELLEFMYQGVVNVKHTELQSFMKIGQLLQIKGLATNTSSSAASTSSEKSSSQIQNTEELNSASGNGGGGSGSGTGIESVTNSNAKSNSDADASNVENNSSNAKSSNACGGGSVAGGTSTTAIGQQRSHSPSSSPTPMGFVSPLTQQSFKSSTDSNTPTLHHPYHSAGAAAAAANMKRHSDISSDALSIYSRKQLRRSVPSVTDHSSEHNDSTDVGGMDQVNAEDFFLSAIPHISMVENRYDLNSVKRESAGDHHGPGGSTASLRNSFGPAAFSFDYNLYKNSSGGGGGSGSGAGGPGGAEFPNDLHMSSDYAKNFGNHMDIPQNNSGNVVMLSSTSLLHGQCVFNRNNTVATQQGMKTYWLCKSYRISMCRARCITHQGRVISATGVHNHAPHMSGNGSGGNGGSGGGGSGTGGNGSSRTNTGYGNDGQSQPMIGPNAAVIPTTNMTTPSGNIPTALMSGASNSNSNNSNTNMGRLHQSSLSSSNSNMYPPSTSLHGHSQHQQQQQHSQSTTPPPTINPLSSTHHAHALHHLPQSLPNLLVQHHSGMAMNSQTSLLHHHQQHHHHHHHQHQHSAAAAQNNSVIQNMMHSANIMNLPNIPQMMTTQQQHQQHSPHISDHQSGMVGSNLEITPLMQSSPQHMQSPSNHSNQSHHGGNSISSPIPPPPPGSSASAMKSPNQTNMSEDATVQHLGDQHLLVHNAAISPSEINSNTVGSAADAANASSQSDARNETPHQAHVIDSITISPGNVHNFKMEDM